jgi:hypothetical protein
MKIEQTVRIFASRMKQFAAKELERAKKDVTRKFVKTPLGLRGSSGFVYR